MLFFCGVCFLCFWRRDIDQASCRFIGFSRREMSWLDGIELRFEFFFFLFLFAGDGKEAAFGRLLLVCSCVLFSVAFFFPADFGVIFRPLLAARG